MRIIELHFIGCGHFSGGCHAHPPGKLASRHLISLLALALFAAPAALAKNVDLSTVPKRNTVQLTIYNSEDLTLVRETRTVTFKKGPNPLQFSWANTLIDPTSVQLRFLTNPEKLEVLDTTFPHDKPQMLYWNVQSDFDGEASVEITYFTSGITWSADYVGVADKDEKQLSLSGFVRVSNRSGEEYEDAQVRLVVGTINLVEKIAQLARIPIGDVERLDDGRLKDLKTQVVKEALSRSTAENAPAAQPEVPAPKQIIKEGLSEYFIFTIEGTETIPNGWSKRLRSLEAEAVPLKVQYRYRPQEYGDQLVRMYLLANTKEATLGASPLPDGAVRVFRDNGRHGLSFLAAQNIKYIPIGDKIEPQPRRGPECDLRASEVAGIARRDLDAVERSQRVPAGRPAGRADRGEQHGGRVGRPRGVLAANPQLHAEADRGGSPPVVPGSCAVPQPAQSGDARFPDAGVHGDGGSRQEGRPAVRDRPPPGAQCQTEQCDVGKCGDEVTVPKEGGNLNGWWRYESPAVARHPPARPRGNRSAGVASNVDLSTVPKRNTVQLTIYNSEDLTLVRETRTVTFKKGPNPLQFSWANTLIDPTSVQLRFLTNPEKLEVMDTTFPHDKPQMLYWNVQSDFDGEASVEITYFTSGITWSADYVGVADKDEKQLSLSGFVRVSNRSGEEYEDAQVRLVVGTINLVEKIAQLAQVPIGDVDRLDNGRLKGLKTRVMKEALSLSDSERARPLDRKIQLLPQNRSSRRALANTSSSRSKEPKPSPTAGRSGCDRWRPKPSPSRCSTDTAPRNMAINSSACTCWPIPRRQRSAPFCHGSRGPSGSGASVV